MEKFLTAAIIFSIVFAGILEGGTMKTFAKNFGTKDSRVEELKNFYALTPHSEGGYFSEVYTSPFAQDNRTTAGSIYFLLAGKDISHFHKIDCDEIWYYHEGCGLKIFVLNDGRLEEIFLGSDTKRGQKAAAIVPAGAIFAAENLNPESYTFVSCATMPKFQYAGFKLFTRQELKKIFPQATEKILRLAYERLPE